MKTITLLVYLCLDARYLRVNVLEQAGLLVAAECVEEVEDVGEPRRAEHQVGPAPPNMPKELTDQNITWTTKSNQI